MSALYKVDGRTLSVRDSCEVTIQAQHFQRRWLDTVQEPLTMESYHESTIMFAFGVIEHLKDNCTCDMCAYLSFRTNMGMTFFQSKRGATWNRWLWRSLAYDAQKHIGANNYNASVLACPVYLTWGRIAGLIFFDLQIEGEPQEQVLSCWVVEDRATAIDAIEFLSSHGFPWRRAQYESFLLDLRATPAPALMPAAAEPELEPEPSATPVPDATPKSTSSSSSSSSTRAPDIFSDDESADETAQDASVPQTPAGATTTSSSGAGGPPALERMYNDHGLPATWAAEAERVRKSRESGIFPHLERSMSFRSLADEEETKRTASTAGAGADAEDEPAFKAPRKYEARPAIIKPMASWSKRLTWSSPSVQRVYDQNFGRWADPELAQQTAYLEMAWKNCSCSVCEEMARAGYTVFPIAHVSENRIRYLTFRDNALAAMGRVSASALCEMSRWESHLRLVVLVSRNRGHWLTVGAQTGSLAMM